MTTRNRAENPSPSTPWRQLLQPACHAPAGLACSGGRLGLKLLSAQGKGSVTGSLLPCGRVHPHRVRLPNSTTAAPRLTHSQTFPTTGRVRPAELYTFDFRKRKGRTRRIHGKQNTIGKQRADAKIRRPSPWIWPVTPRTPVSGAAPARAEKTQGRPCRHAQNNASPVCSYPRLRNPWGWARQRLRNPWGWARQRLV